MLSHTPQHHWSYQASERGCGKELAAVVNAVESLSFLNVLSVATRPGVRTSGTSSNLFAHMQVLFTVRLSPFDSDPSLSKDDHSPSLSPLHHISDGICRLQAHDPHLQLCLSDLKVERDALRVSLGESGIRALLRFSEIHEGCRVPRPLGCHALCREQLPVGPQRPADASGDRLHDEAYCEEPHRDMVGASVLACFYGEWHPARVRSVRGDGLVEVLWESEASISWLPMDDVQRAPVFQPGDKVAALFCGAWYPATVRDVLTKEIEVLWDHEYSVSRLPPCDVISSTLVPPPPSRPRSFADVAATAPQQSSQLRGAGHASASTLRSSGSRAARCGKKLRRPPAESSQANSDSSEDLDLSCVRDESGVLVLSSV
mmetsp:Transcript_35214/g.89532  ORF Transcript_35214/g.89532 Transcript_35214/m.89532 type:complete len:373 (-) Transcript_35214:34-1152(-)